MFRIMTAGESHGPLGSVIIDGLPAGLAVDLEYLNKDLKRRQYGYGRGTRMKIEQDSVEIHSGVRFGQTTGAPVQLTVINRDHKNWIDIMSIEKSKIAQKITAPRPGHADLSGSLKYDRGDIRDILERASARETVMRTAAGALAKLFLREFGVKIRSRTIALGSISVQNEIRSDRDIDKSPLRCADPEAENQMIKLIDKYERLGDSLGGISQITAENVCIGLGSHVHYDRRLDGLIGQAMLSIPSVKGIEIGPAFENSSQLGSKVHDEIFYHREKGFYRTTNRAGGIEGGISNGQTIWVRLAIKPIPTLKKPLKTVDLNTKQPCLAQKERADVCVVPAVGVIGEAMLAIVLTGTFLDKFGSDSLHEIKAAFTAYQSRITNGK